VFAHLIEEIGADAVDAAAVSVRLQIEFVLKGEETLARADVDVFVQVGDFDPAREHGLLGKFDPLVGTDFRSESVELRGLDAVEGLFNREVEYFLDVQIGFVDFGFLLDEVVEAVANFGFVEVFILSQSVDHTDFGVVFLGEVGVGFDALFGRGNAENVGVTLLRLRLADRLGVFVEILYRLLGVSVQYLLLELLVVVIVVVCQPRNTIFI